LVDSASQATAAFHSEDEYRLASEPTAVDGSGGASAQSSRTSLNTQAGKKTGAGSDSGRGTHAEAAAAKQLAADTDDLAARMTRFVMVSEQELRGRKEPEESPWTQWIVAGGLGIAGLIVVVGAILIATRQPSADRLYAQIQAAASKGEPSELAGVQSQMQTFRQQYAADPRAAEVQSLEDTLARYRLEKKAAQQVRRGAISEQASPLERAYNEALTLAATDPEAALARFQAIVAVFEGDSKELQNGAQTRWLELAREQASRLAPIASRLIEEQQALASRQLERAEQLAGSNPEAARRIWRGLVTLYRDKSWARELVATAEQRLKQSADDD
jgi:hypothetical protein